MIQFVNAKINIGLNVVGRRDDGYHDLETVFFPVGIESGLPHQPEPFDDILEVALDQTQLSGCRFQFMGRKIECPPQKNLVVRAATHFLKKYSTRFDDLAEYGMFIITLDKHLPDGAGMGGGSADAAFALSLLNDMTGNKFTKVDLIQMAATLGADCPFFLINRPAFAEGIGERITLIDLNLTGLTLLIVKPDIYISTAEAFAGITPRKPEFDLRNLPQLPLDEWRRYVVNDFEETVFTKFPELANIKENLYNNGAAYASMTGSGAAIYGLFRDFEAAGELRNKLQSTYQGVWLFGL